MNNGFVSRKLSAFRICDFGEARIHHEGSRAMDCYKPFSKSLKIYSLPEHLRRFSRWMPCFKMVDGLT